MVDHMRMPDDHDSGSDGREVTLPADIDRWYGCYAYQYKEYMFDSTFEHIPHRHAHYGSFFTVARGLLEGTAAHKFIGHY
jgi:hypothetical protein